MASITICDRISKETQKITINGVNVKGNVVDLKSLVSNEIKTSPQDIDLVYCGQCLCDQNPVDGYGIQAGSMVYALKKQHPKATVTAGPVRDADMRQMKSTLRTALINPAYRSTVERLLADPEELAKILAGTPGLDNDPVALAMLHDPELLAILINPMNLNSVLSDHPPLAQAAIIISSAVNKEGAKSATATTGASSTGTYSLDQMSDDEDNMTPSQPSGSSGGGQAITASQLAAALNAATGNLTSGAGSSRQNDTPSRITSDFFQQALLQAQGAHAAPPDETTIQSQLEQLRDMGIEDEDVARRALQASGGDIHMALNLIFGDGNL